MSKVPLATHRFAHTLQNDTVVHDGPYAADLAVSQIKGHGTMQLHTKEREIRSPKEVRKHNEGRHDRTAKKCFNSGNNPHDLVRCTQKEKYVWYATYDEEMQSERFMEVLATCNDKGAPIVY